MDKLQFPFKGFFKQSATEKSSPVTMHDSILKICPKFQTSQLLSSQISEVDMEIDNNCNFDVHNSWHSLLVYQAQLNNSRIFYPESHILLLHGYTKDRSTYMETYKMRFGPRGLG